MMEVLDKKKIRKVFRDVQKHLAVAGLIRRFSTNKNDIRQKALDHVDLSRCARVLELGCAFGAFTEALKGRLSPEARITGIDIIAEYKPFFLEACRRAGYTGRFYSSGIEKIKKINSDSFDLILCSYALYFFPEMIPEIARLLQPEGYFITITHSRRDMQEIVQIVRAVTERDARAGNRVLPLEAIFDQFSAENGAGLLQPHFRRIEEIEFKNALVFQPQDLDHFLDYLQFKKTFFLPADELNDHELFNRLTEKLRNIALKENALKMCKDDKIFICSQPIKRNPPDEKET
jgi:ubiquinone/menaquinone biosynthesis C-methylase UbiE